MEVLFLNSPNDLDILAKVLFETAGVVNRDRRLSSNVLGGEYYVGVILGFHVKIELNSYDYEDDYKFMISVRNDFPKQIIASREMEIAMAKLVGEFISKNLKINVAREIAPGELELYVG